MRKAYGFGFCVMLLIHCDLTYAAVWHVDKDAPPVGDGTSWATAFQTIEPAVEAAVGDGGGEVWIAAGIYDEERTGTRGALMIHESVQVYGGFLGNETERQHRDWVSHESVIDGSKSWSGAPAEYVVRLEEPDARLDGLTVLGGISGVHARSGTTLSNCLVRNNEVPGTALGTGVSAGRATIERCTIRDYGREGVVAYGAVIRRCSISRNGSPSFISGGLIAETVFSDHANSAIMIAREAVPLYIESCIFQDNVGFRGGAVFFSDVTDYCPDQEPGGETIFTNCVFANNEAVANADVHGITGLGGAVFVHTQVYPECRGADFAERAALPYPFDPYWPPLFVNCTFVGNRAVAGGALYWKDGSLFSRKQAAPQRMVIANSIFWDNGPMPIAGKYTEIAQQFTGTFTHCIVEGGFTGSSILNVNPQFRDAANGDFRLLPNSPAIDMGRDTSGVAFGSVVTDILGNPRGVDGDLLGPVTGDGSEYDTGAYEFIPVWHAADSNESGALDLPELLRIIQFYNSGALHCDSATEDGYAPGTEATAQDCAPHSSDYNPQDWRIDLNELLRAIQFFNTGGYTPCPESATEDGFCPGGPGL